MYVTEARYFKLDVIYKGLASCMSVEVTLN